MLNFRNSGPDWVYGPFDFADKTKNTISEEHWVKSIPKVIQELIIAGVLHWKGFSDCILLSAGISQERIDDVKSSSPRMEGYETIPVLFTEMDKERMLNRKRVLRNREKEKAAYGNGLWDYNIRLNPNSKGNPKYQRVSGILCYMNEGRNEEQKEKRRLANKKQKSKKSVIHDELD